MKIQWLKWVPVVDARRCTGCNRCVEACELDSLEIVNGIAVLVRPDKCGSDGHCIQPCPEDAIHMEWVELDEDRIHGKWCSGGRAWTGRVRGGRHYR